MQEVDGERAPVLACGASIATEETRTSGKVVATTIFNCHRAPKAKQTVLAEGKNPIRSKKDANCTFGLKVTAYSDQPDSVLVEELYGHVGHTPGHGEDLQWAKLNEEVEKKAGEVSIEWLCLTVHCCFGCTSIN